LFSQAPPCRLEVVDAPPQHSGLGVGTQLSLATAVAVLWSQGIVPPNVVALAAMLGRGRRSAIGTHGFADGGLLVDAGKQAAGEVAPLAARADLPSIWRVVLLLGEPSPNVCGDDEESAFARLPPVSQRTSGELRRLATDEIVPAAATGDFERFAAAVSRFNAVSGECFAAVQGGPYASPQAARWVRRLGQLGAPAGQSSWGPTLFAFAANERRAESLANEIRRDAVADGWRPRIVRPAQRGAVIEET
jgi:beta-RFAP synthase